MTYRFPAVLCSRVSFRLSVRPVVSRVILRGSTFYCFSHCPIRAYTVNVLFVCMGGNDKSVPSLCPAHCQLIADTVRLLRGDLARIEGLPYLITQHIVCLFLFPARHGGITGLCQKKLVRHGGRVALISGDILSAFCFLRVFAIIQTIPDGLGNGFAFARMAL